MVSKPHQKPGIPVQAETTQRFPLSPFLQAVWSGDLAAVSARMGHVGLLNKGYPGSGLTALHIAIGRNNLPLVKALVEAGAEFKPDEEGRMPSVVAAELEVDEELADFICEAESRALQAQGQEDV